MRHFPALSVRFSRHPAEVRHARGGGKVASSYYFAARPIVLHAQSTIAPMAHLYWSVRRAVVVGVPSYSASHAKHYSSVAPSPTACLASFL